MDPDSLDNLMKIYAQAYDSKLASIMPISAGYNGFSASDFAADASAPPTYDHIIKGQMLLASVKMDDPYLCTLPKDEVKKLLAQDLAEGLLKSSSIEFTQQKDVVSGITTIRARCFMVPSGDVQILRLVKR